MEMCKKVNEAEDIKPTSQKQSCISKLAPQTKAFKTMKQKIKNPGKLSRNASGCDSLQRLTDPKKELATIRQILVRL